MKGELVCLAITTVSIVKNIKRNSITVVRTIVSVMTTRTVLLGHQHLEPRNTVNQPVPANTFVKVLFQNEQFDLANEYNPATSIFIPKTRGVYSIIGTIGFFPNNSNSNYRARVEIRVNGNAAIAIDNDFFGTINFGNVVSVSTIIQLNEGDQVEVYAQSSIDGVLSISEDGSHFEAARFPSPTE